MSTAPTTMSKKDILSDTVIFVSLNYRANPKKKGQHYPPFETIPSIDNIYEVEEDEDGEKNERTALIHYKQGQPSIYAPDDYNVREHKAPPILLTDGYLAVNRKEVKLIEYLTKSNYNLNNLNRMPGTYPIFKIRDVAQNAHDFVKQELEETNLKMLVHNMNAEELEAYAMVLGDAHAHEKETSTIRRDLLLLAKHNPEMFKKGLTDKTMKRKVHIMRAFQADIFKYNQTTRELAWKGGKTFASVPFGQDEVDFMVHLSMNDDFKEAYETVLKQLYPSGETSYTPSPIDPSTITEAQQREEAESELSDKALEAKRLELEALKVQQAIAEAEARKAEALAKSGEPTPEPQQQSTPEAPTQQEETPKDEVEDAFKKALDIGVVTVGGAFWHSLGEEKIAQGVPKSIKKLKAEPELYERLKAALAEKENVD